jgi:feruloyl-CoA synthase
MPDGDRDLVPRRSRHAGDADVEQAFAAITPDTIAKFLFTSGSTGTPKGRDQHPAHADVEPAGQGAEPGRFWKNVGDRLVILDWLPWSHTFGANHNFNLVLRNGGTLYVDGGKPAPGLVSRLAGQFAQRDADGLFQRTARLRHADISAARDDELRNRFFNEVKFAFYAGAALPQNLWDALEQLSIETVGTRCRWCRPGARPRPRRSPPTVISRQNAPAISACRFRAPN